MEKVRCTVALQHIGQSVAIPVKSRRPALMRRCLVVLVEAIRVGEPLVADRTPVRVRHRIRRRRYCWWPTGTAACLSHHRRRHRRRPAGTAACPSRQRLSFGVRDVPWVGAPVGIEPGGPPTGRSRGGWLGAGKRGSAAVPGCGQCGISSRGEDAGPRIVAGLAYARGRLGAAGVASRRTSLSALGGSGGAGRQGEWRRPGGDEGPEGPWRPGGGRIRGPLAGPTGRYGGCRRIESRRLCHSSWYSGACLIGYEGIRRDRVTTG